MDAEIAAIETPPKTTRKGKPLPANWRRLYVEQVRKLGLYALAAEAIGISDRTAERARRRDPKFDDACLRARFRRREELEDKLVQAAEKTGNPIGIIARLKAMGAHEYLDKHLITTLQVDANSLPPAQVTEMLAIMLGHATNSTRITIAPQTFRPLDSPHPIALATPTAPEPSTDLLTPAGQDLQEGGSRPLDSDEKGST